VSALPGAVVYPDGLAALGVARGLGPHGVPVTVVAPNRTTPGQYSRWARRLTHRGNGAALVDALVDFARGQAERPVLFLADDAALLAVEPQRARLLRWYRFPSSGWPVLERIMLKKHLYAALTGVVPVPRTALVAGESDLAEADETVGYPALVKPYLRCLSDATGPSHPPFEKVFGSKAVRVRTPADLRRVHAAARTHGFEIVVQEEIEGPISTLFSVGLYVGPDGALGAAFTSRKVCQVPADFGDGLVVEAVQVPGIVEAAVRALRHFGYHGMADIEFKWDDRERVYKLLDINPRPWLWMNLPAACGVNLAWAAYLGAIGRPVDPAAFVQRDFETAWVSARGLAVYAVRGLLDRRPLGELLPAIGGARGRRVGPLLAREDLLYRMVLSPGYWWDSFRLAATGIRRLRGARHDGAALPAPAGGTAPLSDTPAIGTR
jgi:predicted ATP-grasp superfamily ATP-dependent carboligase